MAGRVVLSTDVHDSCLCCADHWGHLKDGIALLISLCHLDHLHCPKTKARYPATIVHLQHLADVGRIRGAERCSAESLDREIGAEMEVWVC